MSGSTLTAFLPIPENSDGTPGLWNSRFQTLQDNIVSINSVIPDPNLFSASTWASIGLFANSSNSDYIRLKDSSGQRSTYRIGSLAGGTADGLNIYDESGQTMIVSFSKQSIRFFQQVVGPVFDIGGALTDTLNAATFGTGADSKETRIQAAINAASNQGISRVYVPSSMYPYSASSVSFINTIQMIREGGATDVYDLQAYGGSPNAADNSSALDGATGTTATGAIIYIPPGQYNHTNDVVLKTGQTLTGAGWSSVLSHTAGQMTNGAVTIKGTALAFLEQCTVRDLKILSSGSSGAAFDATDKGVFQEYANNVHIEHVWFNKLRGEAVYGQTDGSYLWWTDNLITDCAFNALNTNGALHSVIMHGNVAIGIGNQLFEGAGSEFQMVDNTVIGFAGNGIAVGQGAHGIIRGNFLTGGTNASAPAIQCLNAENMVIIDGNMIYENAGRGIVTGGGTGVTERILVANNLLFNNGGPEQMLIQSPKTLVSNNLVVKTSGAATTGIYVDPSSSSAGAGRTVIEGNVAVGHSTADIKRTLASNCTFGRNTVTSGAKYGDRMERVSYAFTLPDFSTEAEAPYAVRIPWDFDVAGLGTTLNASVSTGTFLAAPYRNGNVNISTNISHSTSANTDGGTTQSRWEGLSAGDRISMGIRTPVGVAPSNKTITFNMLLDLKVIEDNSLI